MSRNLGHLSQGGSLALVLTAGVLAEGLSLGTFQNPQWGESGANTVFQEQTQPQKYGLTGGPLGSLINLSISS